MPNAKNAQRKSYTYATKKLSHANSRNQTNTKLLEGRQKGLVNTGKRA
jgi:hypothetical protein